MANQYQLDILQRGLEAWNQWRKENPSIWPDLRDIDFTAISLRSEKTPIKDLSGFNFNDTDFSRSILTKIDLSNCELSKAIFYKADLKQAKLDKSTLIKAHFYEANLEEATLIDVDLSRANLRDANLRNADLTDADLFYTDFSRSDLFRAKLRKANLQAAMLNGANLEEATLIEVDLSRANLRDANLRNANLTNANLFYTDLSRSYLFNANLRKVNLQSAILRGANLTKIQAIEADFRESTLTGACIKDWNWDINHDTILDRVICNYIYLDFTPTKNPKNLPIPPYFKTLKRYPRLLGITDRNFNRGEFAKLCQEKSTQLINLKPQTEIDYNFDPKKLINGIENDRNLAQETKEIVIQEILKQVQNNPQPSPQENSSSGFSYMNYEFNARDLLGNIFGSNNQHSGVVKKEVLKQLDQMIDDDPTLEKKKKDKFKNQIKQLDASLNTNGKIKKVNLWKIIGILGIVGIIGSLDQAIFIFKIMSCHLPWLQKCQINYPLPAVTVKPQPTPRVIEDKGKNFATEIPRTVTDKQGNSLNFSIVVISHEFGWEYQSSEQVLYNKKPVDFKKHLNSPGMQEALSRYKGGIICVGTASSAGDKIEEFTRGQQRAEQLGIWIKESLKQNWPNIYNLNLGKHNDNDDQDNQRRIVLLGIESQSGNIDLLKTAIDEMKKVYKDKQYQFPFNPDDYGPKRPEFTTQH